MMQKIFLISTGRTGTKYFSNFFSNHINKTASYHTTKYTEIINILGNAYLAKKIPKPIVEKIWKTLKYNFIKSHTNKHFIENNPYYLGFLNIVAHNFPNAKFIFVVRRPKDYIISHLNKEYTSFKSKFANRTIPFWQPLPYSEHIMGWKNDFYQRVKFYALVWEKKNNCLFNFLQSNNNAKLIKFENIFIDKNIEILYELLDWLDIKSAKKIELPALSEKINPSQSIINSRWDAKCNAITENICGKLAKKIYTNKKYDNTYKKQ